MPQSRKKEIQARRATIARLFLEGKTGLEIADLVNVSPSQVSRDLKIISGAWQKSAIGSIAEKKAQDLAEIHQVKRELWSAWKRSKKVITKERKKYKLNTLVETIEEKTEASGDPRYMAELLKALKQEAELMGYHADQKLNLNFDQMSDSLLEGLLLKLVNDV